jgi:hypothetical protein
VCATSKALGTISGGATGAARLGCRADLRRLASRSAAAGCGISNDIVVADQTARCWIPQALSITCWPKGRSRSDGSLDRQRGEQRRSTPASIDERRDKRATRQQEITDKETIHGYPSRAPADAPGAPEYFTGTAAGSIIERGAGAWLDAVSSSRAREPLAYASLGQTLYVISGVGRGADKADRSGNRPATSSGFRPVKSTGMALRRPTP